MSDDGTWTLNIPDSYADCLAVIETSKDERSRDDYEFVRHEVDLDTAHEVKDRVEAELRKCKHVYDREAEYLVLGPMQLVYLSAALGDDGEIHSLDALDECVAETYDVQLTPSPVPTLAAAPDDAIVTCRYIHDRLDAEGDDD